MQTGAIIIMNYTMQPVHVSMSTDYNTVVEAMKSKKVDVGFLPPDGYVLAHKQNAGRNLPDKEFRYLRTVIVTAAVYRGFDQELLLADNPIN